MAIHYCDATVICHLRILSSPISMHGPCTAKMAQGKLHEHVEILQNTMGRKSMGIWLYVSFLSIEYRFSAYQSDMKI